MFTIRHSKWSSLRILSSFIKNQSFLKRYLVLNQDFHGNHCCTLGCYFKAGEWASQFYFNSYASTCFYSQTSSYDWPFYSPTHWIWANHSVGYFNQVFFAVWYLQGDVDLTTCRLLQEILIGSWEARSVTHDQRVVAEAQACLPDNHLCFLGLWSYRSDTTTLTWSVLVFSTHALNKWCHMPGRKYVLNINKCYATNSKVCLITRVLQYWLKSHWPRHLFKHWVNNG